MMTDRDEAGRFAAGNRFWEARSTCGPKPKFDDPEALWTACVEYFDWTLDNPLHEAKAFSYEGTVTVEPLPKMRAMTLAGLCLFIDIDETTWREWRSSRPDLSPVITRAEAVIYEQKFTGAAAGLLNPSIIARDLGLADKTDATSSDGSMSPQPAVVLNLSALSDEELDQLERLTDKARNPTGTGKA